MFLAFESRFWLCEEYVQDCHGPCFPFIAEPLRWSGECGMRRIYYNFILIIPLVWILYKLSRLHGELRAAVAWKFFKSWYGRRTDPQTGEEYRCWKPYGYKPANECFAEGQVVRWRDMVVFLWRWIKRKLGR